MRILFLTRRFYPEIGGVEKHCLKISQELLRKGHDITVVSELSTDSKGKIKNNYHSLEQSDTNRIKQNQPVKSTYFEQFKFKGIKVVSFDFGKKNWFKKFRIWHALIREKSLIIDSDIVHCHDVFFWYLPFRIMFPRKKVFTTFHGYESYPIALKAIIVRKISEWLSSGTICVGEFMKKWYFANPDFVIYGGADKPETGNQKSSSKLRAGGIRNGALFIGRLDEQTNILEYCQAVKKIRKKIPDFEFVVAGDGKYRKLAEKYGKVLGFVKNPEKLLQKYRFAFISRYLAILEALAANRPVFAYYDNPIKEDYLKMTPFAKYINIVNNPEKIALIVQKYYSNTKIDQSGIFWSQKLSWSKVTAVYEKLWEQKL
jgi:glycosyltransferase involved in cell wall biosynthesis